MWKNSSILCASDVFASHQVPTFVTDKFFAPVEAKVSVDDFELEIKNEFLLEAKELLTNTERCFLNLEKSAHDSENLGQLFRLAHNLKGSSGAVGFADLADFTHKLESLLLELKEKRIAVTKGIVDLLLRCNDYLTATIETLSADVAAEYKNPSLLDELVRALTSPPGAENTVMSEGRGGLDGGQSANSPEHAEPAPAITLAPVAPSAPPKSKDENIRVSLSRIEKLLNNVGELSILQAVMVQQSIENGSAISSLMRETMSSMSKIIKETQNISMGLRMLPIKQTFHKMERIVRDTSQALRKEVQLHLSGEETEIDKTVLEQIADPLVHIIRNAVDHGLEDAQGREAAGKDAVGQVYLSAFHRAGHVVIEVRDDGKGLDAEKLVAKAKSKGIIAADAQLEPQQAYQLIFAPGFSTKEVVTDVSGRGVGMDVVRTNIAALQGSVEIETNLGKGTCFRIFLPLTLAIIDCVVIRIATERYVIPLAQVSEFFRPQESDINFVYGRSELLTLREEPLPAFRLSALVGREAPDVPAWGLTALIIRDTAGRAFAVLVDQIVAQQQVVIKPLGNEIRGKAGVMGSAILGDGKPALILDLFELSKAAAGQTSSLKTKMQPKMEAV
ncbi:MAG: chemotaxis protein CheA [Bdellovibrionales bacterium]|nr:chemotaxis protein CheA [Bdellovibrionales bacterium]